MGREIENVDKRQTIEMGGWGTSGLTQSLPCLTVPFFLTFPFPHLSDNKKRAKISRMEKRDSLVPQWPCGRLASLKKVNFFRTPSQSAKVEEEDKEGGGSAHCLELCWY